MVSINDRLDFLQIITDIKAIDVPFLQQPLFQSYQTSLKPTPFFGRLAIVMNIPIGRCPNRVLYAEYSLRYLMFLTVIPWSSGQCATQCLMHQETFVFFLSFSNIVQPTKTSRRCYVETRRSDFSQWSASWRRTVQHLYRLQQYDLRRSLAC